LKKKTIKNAIQKLDDKTKDIVKNNLDSWFSFLNTNTVGISILEGSYMLRTFHSMFPNRHPCPLLINGLCSIYDDRPLACRLHIVENNALECALDPYRDTSDASSDVKDKLKAELTKNGQRELLNLSYIVDEVIPTSVHKKTITKWMFG
jgi:Fe-S-cluster containining protein